MRPLKLDMQAFGPYRKKVSIDFTEMKNQSLFLISGPTGAGKTTIFDALTYALYDSSSGESRSKDSFKSDFATDEELCYVELLFEISGKQYHIKRIPSQTGPGVREKIKQYQSSVELTLPDGQIITRIAEVNAEIRQLLSLTPSQFRQIVMLPQGEFRKMLHSGSGEKEELFRNIFETNLLKSFQEELSIKKKKLEKKRDEYQKSIELVYGWVLTNDVEEWEEKVNQAKEKEDTFAFLELLEETITQGSEKREKIQYELDGLIQEIQKESEIYELLTEKVILEKKKQDLDEKEDEIKTSKNKLSLHEKASHSLEKKKQVDLIASELEANKVRLKENQEKQLENKKKLIQEKATFVKTEEDYKETENKRKMVAELEKYEQIFIDIEKLRATILMLETKKINELKEMAQVEVAIEKNNEEIKQTSQEIDQSKGWIQDLKELEEKLNDQETQKKEIAIYLENIQQVMAYSDDLARIRAIFKKEEEKRNQLDHDYLRERAKYNQNMAGILAEDLREKQACPVCGSLEHPNKAHSPSDVLTLDALNELQDQANKQNIQTNKYLSEIEHTQKAQTQLCQKIEIDKVQVPKVYEETLDQQLKLSGNIEKTNQIKDQLKEKLKVVEKLVLAMESQKEKHLTYIQKLARLDESIQSISQRMDEESQKVTDLEKLMPKETKEHIQEQKKEWIKWIEEVRRSFETRQAIITRLEIDLSALNQAVNDGNGNVSKQSVQLKALNDELSMLLAEQGMDDTFEKYVLEKSFVELYKKKVTTYEKDRFLLKSNEERVAQKLSQHKEVQTITHHVDKKEQLEIKKDKKEVDKDRWQSLLLSNKRAHDELEKVLRQSTELEEKYQIYGDLNLFARGSAENNYISFERFVLGTYFDEILVEANIRFQSMTNGRYRLLRKLERSKGGGASGLEMEVMDNYNGKKREVSTLSGGESFKASLALALGLSDVIQNKQGGVHVDTLLIDEGFGTLDTESLDSAVATLIDLNANGRLIGVISHVDELKTRIPIHLEVEKTTEGSFAKLKQ